MSFFDAIKSGFRNYANFKGRASRPEYWWWTLFGALVTSVASGFGDNISGAIDVLLLLPSIAVAVRRMHDVNRRGWWVLVPIANLVFALSKSKPEQNQWGPPPPPRSLSSN